MTYSTGGNQMLASELRDALDHIVKTEGDLPLTISCKQYDTDQGYLVSEPLFIEVETTDQKEVSLRDWAY
jgi:hypothetical protein